MTQYQGGCHCEKIRYEVETDLTNPVISCNCSICSKKGYLLTFVPEAQFKLLKGEDALQDYQFNTMNIHHLFCKTCGVSSFGRGTGPGGMRMYAVNTRCLDNIDLTSLKIKLVDGKSF